MRKKRTRMPVMLALAGLLASFVTFVSSGTAVAAESIPTLQWPAVKTSRYTWDTVTSPSGVTTACTDDNGTFKNLKTYNSSGQVVRDLDASQSVDGVTNCIYFPVVDKNGDLYGKPYGKNANGSWVFNTNVVAYNGNAVKWKYETGCTSQAGSPVVGADGNIYAFSNMNGNRLIGLTPDVAPPTTQPKKVLDIPVTGYGLCSAELFTTKDGVGYINEGRAYLYSYGGKPLSNTPSGTYVDRREGVSANGRAFYDITTGSGDTASFKLVAYNLNLNKVDWTAPESLFGYNPWLVDAYSTPDGGALLRVNRKRVVAGAPTSERITSLIKLNTFGQKLWEKDLPNQDASGNPYNGAYVAVDTTGKIAVVRPMTLPTNDTYNRTMSAISIGVFDGNGNVVYDQIMRGNLDKASGGVNGYTIGGQGYVEPTIGPDTLYFLASCNGTCATYMETKLYPIKVTGLGLDYPRGAVLERTQRPAASYIALGDSFSSGEGVEPFEAGTAIPNLNTCHRSDYAYARLISGSSAKIPSLGSNGFRACSGAVTDNVTDAAQWNEGTQLDLWPDTTTQLVTMTIGGNDIKFGDLGMACVTASCAIGSSAYNASLNEINNTLPGKLKATYERVLKYTPNAKVYVLGYPHVIANKTASDAFDSRCFYMYDNGNTTNKWADVQGARDIVTKLNGKIKDQVDVVRAMNADYNQRLKYVPLDGPDSPFIGHEVCGTASSSWFQNVDQAGNNTAYVFHPNKAGYEGYATVAGAAINAG
ncbi:SGNH/GDSL hydrolase family protein [Streptomyces sp. NPDC006997]|uniref:SGNH/GDSL hydrolase family protein n=1 Tax=Streptomyces sp. NPDC006997 TaxID=3155356 RepID=UPI0033DB4665